MFICRIRLFCFRESIYCNELKYYGDFCFVSMIYNGSLFYFLWRISTCDCLSWFKVENPHGVYHLGSVTRSKVLNAFSKTPHVIKRSFSHRKIIIFLTTFIKGAPWEIMQTLFTLKYNYRVSVRSCPIHSE